MTHHDPDYGHISAHLTQDGDIEIHRDSAVSGITVTPLGTVGVAVALDILKLSGQAHHTIVQKIADTISACAEAGEPLTISEMHAIAATLRVGVQLPIKVRIPAPVGGNVVMFRRAV